MEDIKVVIVEDEPVISEYIAECIEYFGYKVMAKCYNIQEAMDSCKTRTPDIMLLDINLGDKLDGIDLAHHFRKNYNFPIIFITSYAQDKFIERAKEVHPSAYLIKPFDKNALHASISIALHNFSNDLYEIEPASKVKIDKVDICPVQEAFFIKHKGKFIKVSHTDILWIEASDTYCTIHTPEDKYLVYQTLKKMEQKLEENKFARIHRSYIINLSRIESVDANHAVVQNKEIPIGKAFKTNLFSKLELL